MKGILTILLNCVILITLQGQIATNDTTICEGDSLILGVDAPDAISYSWAPEGLLSCTGCPNPTTVELFGPENFSVTTTNSEGMDSTHNIFVEVRSYLDFGLLLFSNSPVCVGDTLAFDPNVQGGQSYTWTGPNGFSSSEAMPLIPDVEPQMAGPYTLGLVDDIGCEAGATFDVEVFPAFETIITVGNTSCENTCDGSIQLELMGGVPPYEVSLNQGVTWSTETLLTGLCPGSYVLSIRDQNCQQEVAVSIEPPLAIEADIIFMDMPDCADDELVQIEIVNISGGNGSGEEYFYSIDGGTTFQPVLDISFFIPVATNAIILQDETGCQTTYPLNITLPPLLEIWTNTTNASCLTLDGGTANIDVSGGTAPYTYDWDTGGLNLNDLSPGNYSLTVTDQNGCSATTSFEITTSPIDAISEDAMICEGGMVQLEASAPDAVFSWSPATGLDDPNSLTPIASPAASTQYILTAEDQDGCTGMDSVLVSVLPDNVCAENYSDTITLGNSNSWCSLVNMLGSPIPFAITEVGCGMGNILGLDIDTLANCIAYTGLNLGTDTLCVTICDALDQSLCLNAFLFLTVEEAQVWPGDTDTNGIVNNFDMLPIGLAYDSVGPIRPNATIDWEGQAAPNWVQHTNSGINYKHIDTNGDGSINADDTLAIEQNWGLEHNFNEEEENLFAGSAPFYVQPDTLIEGETLALPVILGEEAASAEEVYGLAFSLFYDPDMVEDGTAFFNMEGSWIGTPGDDALYLERNFDTPGRVDVGITRIDGINVSGSGQIGALVITVEDDILLHGGEEGRSPETLQFEVGNVRIISFEEEELPVTTPVTEALITPMTSSLETERRIDLKVYPNPVHSAFYLLSKNLGINQVSLYSSDGRFLQTWLQPESGQAFSMEGVSNGVYQLRVQTNQGIAWKRIVKTW